MGLSSHNGHRDAILCCIADSYGWNDPIPQNSALSPHCILLPSPLAFSLSVLFEVRILSFGYLMPMFCYVLTALRLLYELPNNTLYRSCLLYNLYLL